MGNQGDVIHIFAVSRGPARASSRPAPDSVQHRRERPCQLTSPTGNGVGTACPEGIAVSPDGKYLVVALNCADMRMSSTWPTSADAGRASASTPRAWRSIPQGHAYVSNEYSGTISVINPASAKVTATISGLGGKLGDLGSHPEGMVADPHRPALYVAVTNRDLVAVVDTKTEHVNASDLGRAAAGPRNRADQRSRSRPTITTLYASDAGEDAVAAVSLSSRPKGAKAKKHGFIPGLPAYRLIGRIPTAAYPDSVQTTPQGKLIWVAGKGFGSGPEPDLLLRRRQDPLPDAAERVRHLRARHADRPGRAR